ncbi:hybrid sensor histidine kinase/response regulator transcription factor [uncultured Imperialibacter sp.]|uniref:hybrid sensor histidine kinase/response regulator transcription factor n=1 Tax=uncultured Imperialibacter sp. TaxID=1672639 RepID=UPI0030D6ECF1
MKLAFRGLMVLIIFFCWQNLFGQSRNEMGIPLITNFSHKETGGHAQNWATIQDEKGVLYFANTNGVLEFDGVRWRIIETKTGLFFSLAKDENNRIFAGGYDEIGYLAPDSIGQMQFVSLKFEVGEENKDFRNMRRTFSTPEGTYFCGYSHIFRWDGSKMKTWQSGENTFGISFYVNNDFYVQQRNVGLLKLVADSLQLVPGSEKLMDKRFYFMLGNKVGGGLVIGTANDGLYHFDGKEFSVFPTEIDAFLKESLLYHGIWLEDGSMMLSTILGGTVVVTGGGELKYRLHSGNGLQNDAVHAAFVDYGGAVWLALDNGISKVDVASPITRFDQKNGVRGIVNSIIRHDNELYVATGHEVSRMRNDKDGATFSGIEGANSAWSFLTIDRSLVVATDFGIKVLTKSGFEQVPVAPQGYRQLYQSPQNPDIVYGGTTDGVAVFEVKGGKWESLGKLPDVGGEIRRMLGVDSILWLSTFHRGIYRLKTNPGSPLEIQETQLYDTLGGLPSMVENFVYPYGGGKVIVTHRGIFQFDAGLNKFRPDSTFGDMLANGSHAAYSFEEGTDGRAWIHIYNRDKKVRDTGYAKRGEDGKYAWVNNAFAGLEDVNLFYIYSEPNGITWLGGNDLLLRHDNSVSVNYDRTFNTLIRRVIIKSDSLIFGGNQKEEAMVAPKLEFPNNFIRFQFAATSFDFAEKNEYQTMLGGYDEDWSAWTTETQKDFTNLSEGSYTFYVRGRNIYGVQGKVDSYAFLILPPWYRTWWAFVIYLVLFVGTIQFIIRRRSKQLKEEKLVLERIVAQRTQEIEQKNAQLEEQARQLQEMDKVKSNFFANISHEFRTPLTLILGPLNDRADGNDAVMPGSVLSMMKSNADRLLRLINQLLDLSKLETGLLKLEAAKYDFVSFVKGLTRSFDSLAERRGLTLSIYSEVDSLDIFFDVDKIEKVFFNLITNAIKFTEDGGSVSLTIRELQESVEIDVADSGIGIPEDQLKNIFERFYQVDSSITRFQEGSGIGLALTRELVELHHGSISVSSTRDKGTVFTVKLLKGSAHFGKDEIVAEKVTADVATKPAKSKVLTETGIVADDGRLVVLVVEDNPDVRAYIKSQLEGQFRILEAGDGEEGLAMSKEKVPDLIISDVMMPVMDGYTLTKKLKEHVGTSHIPVVLLTARADSEDKIEGLVTGADDYLTKPFDGKELAVRIDNLINIRQKLRERIRQQVLLEPSSVEAMSMDETFIRKAVALLEKHLADSELNVEWLSDEMSMSRMHLHRKLKALTDQSPSEFIRSIRLKRAHQLIRQRSATVTEIAFEVGFNNLSYFSKCFKEEYGLLPSELEEKSSH